VSIAISTRSCEAQLSKTDLFGGLYKKDQNDSKVPIWYNDPMFNPSLSAVLIATLGSEPQVVTLLLDALLERGIPIQRVEVLHTRADGAILQALERLQHTFLEERHYPKILFVPQLLMGSHAPLDDVTTPDEIDAAFRQVYFYLRQHKQANRQIHLGIAGGRKTMTVFALAAAQWVLGSEDAIWHLISPASLVVSKAMHADPDHPIQIIQVPLVYVPPDSAKAQAQRFLDQLTPAERELAYLLLREGVSNAQLASRLSKSPSTIANQLTTLYRKFGEFYHLPTSPDRALFVALLSRYID